MRNADSRTKLLTRLKRIEGQVAGLRRMLEEDADCVDVMLQISAAQGALGKVGHLLLNSHVRTCVTNAIESGSAAEQQERLDELMQVFARYGGQPR